MSSRLRCLFEDSARVWHFRARAARWRAARWPAAWPARSPGFASGPWPATIGR